MTAQIGFFFPGHIAVTTATDVLVTVILYNTPTPTPTPQRVTCPSLALAAADTEL